MRIIFQPGAWLVFLVINLQSGFCENSRKIGSLEGIELSIVDDLSRSMDATLDDHVRTNRAVLHALDGLLDELNFFLRGETSRKPCRVQLSLVRVKDGKVDLFGYFGILDPEEISRMSKTQNKGECLNRSVKLRELMDGSPNGKDSLGEALRQGGLYALRTTALKRKHVILLTDTVYTGSYPLEPVVVFLKKEAENAGVNLGIHFILVGSSSKLANSFKPIGGPERKDKPSGQMIESLKSLGVTVLKASTEQEVKDRVNAILNGSVFAE